MRSSLNKRLYINLSVLFCRIVHFLAFRGDSTVMAHVVQRAYLRCVPRGRVRGRLAVPNLMDAEHSFHDKSPINPERNSGIRDQKSEICIG